MIFLFILKETEADVTELHEKVQNIPYHLFFANFKRNNFSLKNRSSIMKAVIAFLHNRFTPWNIFSSNGSIFILKKMIYSRQPLAYF